MLSFLLSVLNFFRIVTVYNAVILPSGLCPQGRDKAFTLARKKNLFLLLPWLLGVPEFVAAPPQATLT